MSEEKKILFEMKAGAIGCVLSPSTQRQFLRYNIRIAAAWEEIEAYTTKIMKQLFEIEDTYDLRTWVFNIDNITGEIVLERRKTNSEIELAETQRELLSEHESTSAEVKK